MFRSTNIRHRDKKGFLITLLFFLSVIFCYKSYGIGMGTPHPAKTKEHTKISFTNSKIQYVGRVGIKPGDAAYLYWPGTIVRVRFRGTGIKAYLLDDSINNAKNRNHFYIILDGKLLPKQLTIERGMHPYVLATGLKKGKHTIELYKLNSMHPGYPRGYVKFYGFEFIGKGKLLNPSPLPKRKMEFYGNSITCGVSNEAPGVKKDLFGSKYENNYWSYGAITARYFHAQFYCISKSGIGLIKGTTKPNMLQMYDQVNPFDTSSRWNFSKYTPDIVVVNLLQNDASHIPDKPSHLVVAKYKEFIRELRIKYPETYIICTLGPMSAVTKPKWQKIVKDAVHQLNDSRLYLYFYPYLGRPHHPRVGDDKSMAKGLINFIKKNVPVHW